MMTFVNEHKVVRRIIVLVTMILVVHSYAWAIGYAEAQVAKSGTDVGLVVAAVTAPLMLFVKAIIGMYFEARK